MSDLLSRLSISEDNTSIIDFNEQFSFKQETTINNSHSESNLVQEENSCLQNKTDNDNIIFLNPKNFFENNINNKGKNNYNKNCVNNNNFIYNDFNNFQQNSINSIPKEPFFQKNNISPYFNFQINQINSINNSPIKEIKINNNNLPLFYPITQYNQLNQIYFNNFAENNNNPIQTFFKSNSKIIFNNKNRKNKNKKNIIKKIDEKKCLKTFLKSENIIKIELLESGEEKRTCVRLLPIPHKYSPFDIIRLIDKYLKTIPGKRIYRSVYVPLIKVIGKNIGYCFIDLVSPKYVIEFYNVFNGLLLKKCKKPCSVIFSDKQNSDNKNENPLREPIFFKDIIKDEK